MMRNIVRRNYTVIAYILLLFFIFNAAPLSSAETFAGGHLQSVYVGGFPIGLMLKPKGIIVVGAASVETELGNVVSETPLQNGDIIEKINGKEIFTVNDIYETLSECEVMTATVTVKRGTATIDQTVNLIKEDMTGDKKLGLRVRESVNGVGTVTYVKNDGTFACLGHPIMLDNDALAPCFKGYAFDCKIIGYNKGLRGKAGELKGTFVSANPTGTLYKNCKSGVYGKIDAFPQTRIVEIADRHNVNIGKASILTTVGDKTEEYSIEIIKTSIQNSVSAKSMIIRITDKRLLSSTGGIVQGMSGSPIIQNNRLVGAVTHVFISDPTKGYGIYADWMLKNE